MKFLPLFFSIIILLMASCNNPTQQVVITTVEITKIIQITTTPAPTITLTPRPTLNIFDNSATEVANAIGTPIKASYCYKTTDTQGDMDNCSNQRRSEVESQMDDLTNKIEGKYQRTPDDLNSFIQFQTEWVDFATKECNFRSGHILVESNDILYYKGGSMALTSYNECLVEKYEDRLRELQILLYNFSF